MMSPFREAPRIELGPLHVGLAPAAERAIRRLPHGGRVVRRRPDGSSRLVIGVLGMALFVGTAIGGWRSRIWPVSIDDLAAAPPLVLIAGVALAFVLRAFDGGDASTVLAGETVRLRAASVLGSLAGLEDHADRAFIDPHSIRWLRRVLANAEDPDIASWIPRDVRGRGELLLAREIAAYQGTAFAERRAARDEVAALLSAAADHLDDPSAARADLAALEQSPHVRVHRVRRSSRYDASGAAPEGPAAPGSPRPSRWGTPPGACDSPPPEAFATLHALG